MDKELRESERDGTLTLQQRLRAGGDGISSYTGYVVTVGGHGYLSLLSGGPVKDIRNAIIFGSLATAVERVHQLDGALGLNYCKSFNCGFVPVEVVTLTGPPISLADAEKAAELEHLRNEQVRIAKRLAELQGATTSGTEPVQPG